MLADSGPEAVVGGARPGSGRWTETRPCVHCSLAAHSSSPGARIRALGMYLEIKLTSMWHFTQCLVHNLFSIQVNSFYILFIIFDKKWDRSNLLILKFSGHLTHGRAKNSMMQNYDCTFYPTFFFFPWGYRKDKIGCIFYFWQKTLSPLSVNFSLLS